MEDIKPKACSECGHYHDENVSCEMAKKRRKAFVAKITASVVAPASKNT